MIQKTKTYKEKDNEKNRGKKRYIERTIEEIEAEKEIKEYKRDEDITDDSRTDRFDGLRSECR